MKTLANIAESIAFFAVHDKITGEMVRAVFVYPVCLQTRKPVFQINSISPKALV